MPVGSLLGGVVGGISGEAFAAEASLGSSTDATTPTPQRPTRQQLFPPLVGGNFPSFGVSLPRLRALAAGFSAPARVRRQVLPPITRFPGRRLRVWSG